MKEKIEQFARGEFEYKLPFLRLSVEAIEFKVEAGKQYEGSFVITNSADRIMKGVLFSSNRLLTFNHNGFKGKEITVTYRFDASYLNPSDIIKGNITILSDCGEATLPFTAYLEASAISTSIGKIKNLDEFVSLARMDWTEAKKVFRSDEFEPIVLKNHEEYHVIYRNLLKSISTSQALEEFLIAVNKKSRINLCVDKTVLEYDVQDEDILDKLILTKDHWGYAEIRVSSDTPFIQLEQKFLWSDRFIGNNHQISFIIKANKVKTGNNYGRIYIKTVHQTIVVEVVCRNHKEARAEQSEIRKRLRFNYDYTRNYLDFRIGRTNMARYLQDTKVLLGKINEVNDSFIVRMINIHMAILAENKLLAGQLLEELSKEEAVIRRKSDFEYCAYLYLVALYKKDEKTIQYVTDTISRYYMKSSYDWRILWFLLFTDKRYDRNRNLKLGDIKEQFNAGCHSPILYYEAVCIYNEEPYLLRDLTDFEIQVINYGIKNDCLTEELALQYTYLAGRLKYYNPIVYRGLVRLYEIYNKDEILSSICSLLIKGYKKDIKYFEWYSRGVNAQLRITQLYEYYMYSADEDKMNPLPESLLLYFAYNSRLNDMKKAYLYANIIKNHKNNEQIYQLYYKKIEQFIKEQLEAKNINQNLALIYREFIDNPSLSNYFATYLPEVMFTQEIYCANTNMVSVAVVHKELDEEEIIPLTDGKAGLQIYTTDAKIFLIDSLGNRYVKSVEYSLKQLLMPEELSSVSLEYESHPRLLLYLYDQCRINNILDEDSIRLRKKALLVPGLKQSYYIDCLLTLIEYYYENYNTDLLEHYLMKLDLSKVKEADRIKYLEYMVIRGYYDKALEALNFFGTEGISIQRLLKLCSGWISYSGLDTKEELLVSLCYYIFAQGKYDETILNYLIKYYNGSTSDMLKLWRTAKNFDIDTHDLEERLLAQFLFTEDEHEEKFEVFLEYYQKVTNHLLVKAFLTYYAYKYLVHDNYVDRRIFPIVRRELNYEMNNITLLSWLKYCSQDPIQVENDKTFISYHIDRFERQGIILPFFKNFKDIISLPERITCRSFVEYKTDPKKQVFLHYKLLKNTSSEEYITERMPNILLGIHVKDFLLFYNEEVEYYITEESQDEVNITKHSILRFEEDDGQKEDSKYNRINTMLKALDRGDEVTLLNMMEDYIESEYIINENFEPLP